MIPNPKPKGRDASSRALKICDLGLRESEVHTVSGPVTMLPTVTFKRLRTRHPALHVRKSIILKTSLLPQHRTPPPGYNMLQPHAERKPCGLVLPF